jgi:hypothetical protein
MPVANKHVRSGEAGGGAFAQVGGSAISLMLVAPSVAVHTAMPHKSDPACNFKPHSSSSYHPSAVLRAVRCASVERADC